MDSPIFIFMIWFGGKKRVSPIIRGIDVNGQFMGDGSIAFVSNRLGYPNIFSKRIGSSAVSQLGVSRKKQFLFELV
jgi:hypothetical protein